MESSSESSKSFSTHQVVFTTVIASVILFILYVRKKYTFWKSRGVPGPEPKFLIGNTFDGFGKPFFTRASMHYQKYGSVYGTYNGLTPSLVCGDLNMIKNLCVKDFHMVPQSFSSIYLHPVERTFLSNIWGPRWKRIRSLISPTFSSGKIKKMFKLMQACIGDAMGELDEISEKGGSFNPKLYWGRYNMDLIARCCFAVSFHAKDDNDPLLQNFIEFFKGNLLKILIIVTSPEWFVRFLRISFSPAKNLEFLRDLTLQLIENRKRAQKESYNDFLQLLLDAEGEIDQSDVNKVDPHANKQHKLTAEEIVGASVIFLVAGYETTSTLLMWACYRLAMNPDIQEKLYQELKTIDINDYDELISLPYLDAVINETLRIDPPVVMFQRVPHQDYPVPGQNYIIPKYTRIIIPTYSIHHDPQNYPNPEQYDPDRFLPENKDSIKPFTFVPFGAGPRICIGMRFALVNAKLSLATIITKFRLVKTEETVEKPEYSAGSIILTSDNLKIGLEKRN